MANDKKKRRKYEDSFKIETLKAWRRSGKSAAAFGAEIGIPDQTIYNWSAKFETSQGIVEPDVNEELKRLRKENADLKQEAAILKKAMGYFASPK